MARPSINGVRMHVILTKQQEAAMRKYAEKTGLTVTEHFRRAVDFYLARVAAQTTKKPR